MSMQLSKDEADILQSKNLIKIRLRMYKKQFRRRQSYNKAYNNSIRFQKGIITTYSKYEKKVAKS